MTLEKDLHDENSAIFTTAIQRASSETRESIAHLLTSQSAILLGKLNGVRMISREDMIFRSELLAYLIGEWKLFFDMISLLDFSGENEKQRKILENNFHEIMKNYSILSDFSEEERNRMIGEAMTFASQE